MRFFRRLIRVLILGMLSCTAIVTSLAALRIYFPPSTRHLFRWGLISLHQFPPGRGCFFFDVGPDEGPYFFLRDLPPERRVEATFGYKTTAAGEYHKKDFPLGPLSFSYERSRYPGEPPNGYSDEEKALWYIPQVEFNLNAPAWLLPPLFAAYPIIAFIRGPLRRRKRFAEGACVRCGYNLTGNISGVCPECGTKIQQA